MTTIEQVKADFELLDEWEDRYRYIIDLGRKLPALAPDLHNEHTRVRGCASQVWLHAWPEPRRKYSPRTRGQPSRRLAWSQT